MVVYSINDIEKLSGVKAHTIRVWEKRYGIIKPKRTDTNIRYYLDDDVQKILNIALLNKKGIKISKICEMTDEEIKAKVSSISEVDAQFEDQIDGLILSVLELNQAKFERIVNHNIDQRGLEEAFEEVLYPLLDKLEMMWIAGSIKGVHENFVSTILRRKIIVNIDQIVFPEDDAIKVMVYLPENEANELSLLYLQYIIRKLGYNVVNLGQNVTLKDVVDGYQIFNPEYVITLINDSFAEQPLQPYIDHMSTYMPDPVLIFSGYQTYAQNISSTDRVKVLSSLKDIVTFFEQLVKRKQ